MGQAASTATTSSLALSSTSHVPSSTVYPKCPSVKLTTRTTTITSTLTTYTTTMTGVATVPKAITTLTSSVVATENSPARTVVGTTTITFSPVYILSQAVPITTTVTIPTSRGFTALRCEATYQQPHPPTKTITKHVTESLIAFAIASTVTESTTETDTFTDYFSTVTAPFAYSVYNEVDVTPTSTITRTNPTSTVWAACNANNVVADHPLGNGYFSNAYPLDPNIQVYVPSFGPTNCCERCQANSTCLGYAYVKSLDTPCNLFLLDPSGTQTCNPKYVGGVLADPDDPSPGPLNIYAGNGGCGQVQFLYDQA